jgi:short subunit fatty acids transporter
MVRDRPQRKRDLFIGFISLGLLVIINIVALSVVYGGLKEKMTNFKDRIDGLEGQIKEMREKGGMTFGVWLEHSRWPVWLISLMGFSYIVYYFYGWGFDLDLNIINFLLLFLAFAFTKLPGLF